jgi:hypothetical protein
MQHDAWFFVGIFVFIFLVWAATGGPIHSLSFSGPSLPLPQELGGGTYLNFPRAPFGIGGNSVSLPGSSSGGGSVSGSGSSWRTTIGIGNASPYRSLVNLSHSVSGLGSSDPKREYLQLSIMQDAGAPVSVSGWSLRSLASGTLGSIPLGTEVPRSGVVNGTQSIVLSPGDRALIISGQSPIGGSFRENKCIGYFSTFQTFTPSLPQNCPDPSDELATHYGPDLIRDGKCTDYVKTLSRCQVVLTPPPSLSSSCQSFLMNYLNYNGCVSAHENDLNFKGDTWRIYLGRSAPLWQTTHETVELLDQNGKSIDSFTY